MRLQSPLWEAIGALPPRGAEQHRMLLINQAAWSDQPDVLRALGDFDRVPLLGQDDSACVDGATPLLLRLDGQIGDTAATRPLRRLCATGCYASGISVIDSSLSLPALADALSQRCDAQLHGGPEMLLRLFDARVLEAFLDMLDADGQRALVGCASNWWWSSREGGLVPIVVSPWPEQDAFSPPWRLTEQQEAALLEAGEADAMVDLLSRHQVQALLDLPYPRRQPAVHQMIEQCRALNIGAISDQAAYCTLVLMSGRRLEDDVRWEPLLPRVRKGDISFIAAIRELEEAAT
jgi:Domain of unknown function (DUF4123)